MCFRDTIVPGLAYFGEPRAAALAMELHRVVQQRHAALGQIRMRQCAVAALLVGTTDSGRSALQALCPSVYCGGGYGVAYGTAPGAAYAAANYGVATGLGGPLGGGPTLPLASVVARNAERVAANSDALLRLYQHANAGLFATNQVLLRLQNEVQAAEGTWSTVPMEFPAAYHGVPGVLANGGPTAVANTYAPPATATTTFTTGGCAGCVTKTLREAKSARAATTGAITAAQATLSSPVAAKSAPPGFHLAWVPNKKATAVVPAAGAAPLAPTTVVGGPPSAWNWRGLARAQLTAPFAQSTIYKSEAQYPYISGPYRSGSVNLFRPL